MSFLSFFFGAAAAAASASAFRFLHEQFSDLASAGFLKLGVSETVQAML